MLARQVVLLTSSESSHPMQLPSRQQSTPLNHFSCNTYGFPRKCCKQKTYGRTKPFRCNTYKKQGGRGVMVNQLPLSSNVPTRLQPPFVLNRFHTLSFSISCNSCVCHSYENCQVCTNNSQSGTLRSTLARRHSTNSGGAPYRFFYSAHFAHLCDLCARGGRRLSRPGRDPNSVPFFGLSTFDCQLSTSQSPKSLPCHTSEPPGEPDTILAGSVGRKRIPFHGTIGDMAV